MRPVQNPPSPFETVEREWLEEPPTVQLEVFEEEAHSIITENSSPDLGFRWSINPYRGCFHACCYCYARDSHQYLGFGAGTDFESKIVVKVNAPEMLRRQFMHPSWQGEFIAFSGNTDCYQPLEATYRLTRRCLEICAEFRNPIGIITKSVLVQRDIDVLQRLNEHVECAVFFSIAFADDVTGRAIEPQAPLMSRRFEAMRRLSQAGIPTGVSVAPIIPGLNDEDIPSILERAREAGAKHAAHVLLRLSGSVRPVFLERIRAALPERARRIENRIRDVRRGTLNDSRFFERQRGHGVYWDLIESQWQLHARRLGFVSNDEEEPDLPSPFRRPGMAQQGTLF